MACVETCDEKLQVIATESIKITPYDFSITEGHRSKKRQLQLFREGKSKIDGINKMGKHNYDPSRAFDFVPYIRGNDPWSKQNWWLFHTIAGVFLSVAAGNGIQLRWGGDWDGDGTNKDQSFHDLPHLELR